MGVAEAFRELHRTPPMLVLPNAWDVASARAFAVVPGCRALATTSGGVARALGYDDGEQAPRDEMLAVAARIAAAVDVPVTADVEAGYGNAVETARDASRAGLAGINLEDSRRGALLPADEQVAILEAVRAAVPELVVNARVDVFIRHAGGVDDAVARANAYLAAGADCVYPIMAPREVVHSLVAGIAGPVNVLARPGDDLGEYAAAGVARVTFGTGLAAVALGAAEDAVRRSIASSAE